MLQKKIGQASTRIMHRVLLTYWCYSILETMNYPPSCHTRLSHALEAVPRYRITMQACLPVTGSTFSKHRLYLTIRHLAVKGWYNLKSPIWQGFQWYFWRPAKSPSGRASGRSSPLQRPVPTIQTHGLLSRSCPLWEKAKTTLRYSGRNPQVQLSAVVGKLHLRYSI